MLRNPGTGEAGQCDRIHTQRKANYLQRFIRFSTGSRDGVVSIDMRAAKNNPKRRCDHLKIDKVIRNLQN